MTRFFIEWESGRTEFIEVDEHRVRRAGKVEKWPKDWPGAVLSAVELRGFITSSQYHQMTRELRNLGGL